MLPGEEIHPLRVAFFKKKTFYPAFGRKTALQAVREGQTPENPSKPALQKEKKKW